MNTDAKVCNCCEFWSVGPSRITGNCINDIAFVDNGSGASQNANSAVNTCLPHTTYKNFGCVHFQKIQWRNRLLEMLEEMAYDLRHCRRDGLRNDAQGWIITAGEILPHVRAEWRIEEDEGGESAS